MDHYREAYKEVYLAFMRCRFRKTIDDIETLEGVSIFLDSHKMNIRSLRIRIFS